jgi:DNA-binding beta-propeller fold protein YncE
MKTPYFKLLLILLIAISWTVTDKASGQGSKGSSSAFTPDTDTLYVANAFGDAPVIGFNASSGAVELSFVADANAPISGQHGVLVAGGELILVNQNAGQEFAGDIQQFLLRTGEFAGFLVPHENNPGEPNPDAPFVPDAAVLIKGILFVSNFTAGSTPTSVPPGAIYVFKGDGTLLKKIDSPPALAAGSFHPRGMVLNPKDGLLYVANCPNPIAGGNAGNGGQVLKFDPSTLEFKGVFIDDAGGVNGLNRPDGLVFGPDGNLYVTSFRFNSPPDSGALDSIRVYNRGGNFKDSIPLNNVNEPRSFAQAILFGPGGKLFVPISGNDPATTGEIRTYDVKTKQKDVFVPIGTLASPQYLTFGRTDPATLAYGFETSRGFQ